MSSFPENPRVYWSGSITNLFINYPYKMNPALLIGNYLAVLGSSANNSFLSTGYMHAGIWGIIFYSCSRHTFSVYRLHISKGYTVVGSGSHISSFHALNSMTCSQLLTHGLGIAVLILFLFRKST